MRKTHPATRDPRLAPLFECSSFEDIAKWIVEHRDIVEPLGRNRFINGSRVRSISFVNMVFDAHQSNSRNAPFGGTTNWTRDADFSTGYPGFCGRITITYDSASSPEWDNDCFKIVGLCTGGGSGYARPFGYQLSYDVIIWASDFPKLTERFILDYVSEFTQRIDQHLSLPPASQIKNAYHMSRLMGEIEEYRAHLPLQYKDHKFSKIHDLYHRSKGQSAKLEQLLIRKYYWKTHPFYFVVEQFNSMQLDNIIALNIGSGICFVAKSEEDIVMAVMRGQIIAPVVYKLSRL